MATALQRRRKAASRRAHAERRDRRTGQKFASPGDRRRYHDRLGRPIHFDSRVTEHSVSDLLEAAPSESTSVNRFWSRNGSSRARCSVCGKKEKTTKAGLIGKHGDCTGAGKEPADG